MTPLNLVDTYDSATALEEALRLHRAGRFTEAQRMYEAVLQKEPNQPDALHLLGLIALQGCRYQIASELIEKAVSVNPMAAEYHNSLGQVCRAKGDEATAVKHYLQAIQLRGDYLDPYNNIIRFHPGAVEVRFNLGLVLHRQGNLSEALIQYNKVLELQPDHAGAHTNRGGIFRELDQFEEARRDFEETVRLEPRSEEAHNNLGQLLHDQGMLIEAIASFASALYLQPDFAEVYCNMGSVFHEQGLFDKAIEFYRRSTELVPELARAYYNWGCSLNALHRYHEAIVKHSEAIRIFPEYVEAHVNKAFLLLLTGNYLEAWPEYEWRLKRADWLAANSFYADLPRWDGSDVSDKSIVVLSEQGFGDTIQFARYLPLVKGRCRKLVVEAQTELHPLLAMMPDIDELTLKGSDSSRRTDLAVSIMSLPGIFQTTAESVPGVFPYLHVPESRLEKFRHRFSQDNFNIGIAWSGNTAHPENGERACGIEPFFALAALPSVRLFSLQKGEPVKEIDRVPPGLVIDDLGHELHDFADTAAVIAHLDLVISVDTALVHLAGALGKPVWTIRYHLPYWVWGLEGDTTPWYASMRIFRQRQAGDWQEVFAWLMSLLDALFRQSGRINSCSLYAGGLCE
ncbi:MAG: tetratricopeptide repeat protein [Desulfobulbaceae bacterium]|nr:tetratricopeptide repeat protein [Desulfobulbaceae bacterium]